MSAARSARLNSIRELIPVGLQVSGLLGFIAAQVLWLGFKRPEPEFMAICVGVAGTGYIGQGLAAIQSGSPSPPPLEPADPAQTPPQS